MVSLIDLSPLYQWFYSTGIPQALQMLTKWIIDSQFFQNYGLLVMFIWEALPTFVTPIPLAVFMTPLLAVGISPYDVFLVALAGSVSGSFIFYLGTKMSIIHLGKKEIEEMDESHFVHRHRWWIFALAPIFFLTGDGLMIYAGAKNMPIHKFIIPLFIGNVVRIGSV